MFITGNVNLFENYTDVTFIKLQINMYIKVLTLDALQCLISDVI